MEHVGKIHKTKGFCVYAPKYTVKYLQLIYIDMKKQFIKTLSVVLLLIGAFMVLGGCEKKKENKNPLKNTEWKLVNFVDVANNTNKIPEPNSEMCYILKFLETGDSLTAVSSTNNFIGTYTIDIKTSSISITSLVGTKINEIGDGVSFVKSLNTVDKYMIDNNILKLYYDDNKNCLEFKRR